MMTWVFALPTNKTFWAWSSSKKDYTPRLVTTEQARRIVEETQRALAHWAAIAPEGSKPYTPPVLREHERSGARCGSIVGIKLSGLLERRGIWLQVDWLDATYEDIESYKSQHVSIGTVPSYRDGTGEVFGPIVDELSLTEHPRMKDIGSIQDTLTLRLSDALEQEMNEEEIQALMDRIAALETKVAELEAKAEEQVEEVPVDASDEEEMPVDEEIKASDIEALGLRLADQIYTKLEAKLTGKRQGERPNATPPTGQRKLNTPEAKVAAARQQGLVGKAAIVASLK